MPTFSHAAVPGSLLLFGGVRLGCVNRVGKAVPDSGNEIQALARGQKGSPSDRGNTCPKSNLTQKPTHKLGGSSFLEFVPLCWWFEGDTKRKTTILGGPNPKKKTRQLDKQASLKDMLP